MALALINPLGAVRFVLTSPFGWRINPITKKEQQHNGLDLAVPTGTPVYAAAGGRVVTVYRNHAINGNAAIIAHDGGYRTAYLHLNTLGVSQGDAVAQGQNIGTVGMTGRATGPHLHFIVYRNGAEVDPYPLVMWGAVKTAAGAVRRVPWWAWVGAAALVVAGVAARRRRARAAIAPARSAA